MSCTADLIDGVKTQVEVDVRIAATRAEREAAFRLVYQAYLSVNLCGLNRFRMRVTPYHLLPTTDVFNVWDTEVDRTLTLVRDGQMGLPMQSVFAEEVDRRRAQGLQLAEVCSLAARYEGLKCVSAIFELFRLMAHFGHHHGVDQILALIQPHHERFYQRFMAFERIGPMFTYPSACDCQVVPMCLDLHAIQRDPPKHYQRFLVPIPEHRLQAYPISATDREYFRRVVDEIYGSAHDGQWDDQRALRAVAVA